MALFDNIFGGRGAANPAAAGSRTPFERVFDPEAQRTTLTGFLGRVMGNPTADERQGAAGGALMAALGQRLQGGMQPKQAFIETLQSPEFMDAFASGNEDIGLLMTQMMKGLTEFQSGPASEVLAPGAMIAQQGPDGSWGPALANPTAEMQKFRDLSALSGLSEPALQEIARAQLMGQQDGTGTAEERALNGLVAAGLIDRTQANYMLANGLKVQEVRHPVSQQVTGYNLLNTIAGTYTPLTIQGGKVAPAMGVPGPDGMSQPPVQAPAGTTPSAFTFSLNEAPPQYQPMVSGAADKYKVDGDFLASLINQESHWNPRAESPAGARGIAQFMPATAAEYGINPDDPAQAIDGAGRYLRSKLNKYDNDYVLAAISYNAGDKRVERFINSGRDLRVLPEETQLYLGKIFGKQIAAANGDALGVLTGQPPLGNEAEPGTYRAYPEASQPVRPQGPPDAALGIPLPEGWGQPVDLPELAGAQPSAEFLEEAGGPVSQAGYAAFGSGPIQSFGSFLGNLASTINPEKADRELSSQRQYLNLFRESVVDYYRNSGRVALGEQERVLSLIPNMITDTPITAIYKLQALRDYVAQDLRRQLDIYNDERNASPTMREEARKTFNTGYALLQQLGTPADLKRAEEMASRIRDTGQLSYIGNIFKGLFGDAESFVEEGLPSAEEAAGLGGAPEAPQQGVDAKTFQDILNGIDNAGPSFRIPDDVLQSMTGEQLDAIYERAKANEERMRKAGPKGKKKKDR